ncbi:hypothetical protein NMG60_11005084 [Bertholletia excelsa]
MAKDREWQDQRDGQINHGPSSEEKKLELKLGLPGDEDWSTKDESGTNNGDPTARDKPILSLGYLSPMANCLSHNPTQRFSFSENPAGTGLSSPWSSSSFQVNTQQANAPFLQLQSNPQNLPAMSKESSQSCSSRAVELQSAEKKALSPAPAKTAVANSAQKRTAPPPVVGWPPIRSFRKNLASSSSSKPIPETQNVPSHKVVTEKPVEICSKGFFVKINMDGVPIGRKVDLKAYDSYEKLSSAVDELFRGLLAAQRDTSACVTKTEHGEEKEITGLLDGSGEYTLVYEDNEGDRMLVGDVPWHMFVSTVKRLRVLKSSELSRVCFGNKKGKMPLDGVSN